MNEEGVIANQKHYRHLKKIALFSIPVAIIIFTLKYIAYSLTNSVALYSDALESLVNIISALAVWWSLHISVKPADDDHPFGHYKAEYFSAGFVSMLVIFAAGLILYTSVTTLIAGKHVIVLNIGVAINMFAGMMNALWAFYLLKQAKKYRSEALKADAMHIVTDVITSCGVLIGVFLVYCTKWEMFDSIIAILVAINILWEGWKILDASVQGLMDGSLTIEDVEKIKEIISRNCAKALEAHDLKTRRAGRAIFIEFHLIVTSTMTVATAHEICDCLEDALKKAFSGAYIVIHVEPEDEAHPSTQQRILPIYT